MLESGVLNQIKLISRNGVITTNDIKVNGVNVADSNSLTGVFFFDIPFVFNTPFQFPDDSGRIRSGATTAAGDQASATSNFARRGFGAEFAVHRADGTVLTGYSLLDSGYDWSKAYAARFPSLLPRAVDHCSG